MAAPIGPGDWVQVVTGHPEDAPDDGNVFYVVEVGRDCDGWCTCGSPDAVTLHGDSTGLRFAWCVCEVRPLRRPSESLFLQRLMDVPAPEHEDA